MDVLFILLSFACLITLLIGLFKPNLFKKKDGKVFTRKEIAVTYIILFILFIYLAGHTAKNRQQNETENASLIKETVNTNTAIQSTVTPTNTPTPAEKYNIVVTNKIVKKVDGKYRYFFDIRNKDTKPFEGSVTINLFTEELKNPIAGDSFTTNKPIDPELGTVVYTDAHTAPPSIHGVNGISKFTFIVRKGDSEVNSGEGVITDEFEDMDAYGF